MNKINVLVTLDSVRYPNTGLYHFGKSLGRALIKENDSRFNLNYFFYPSPTEFDESDVNKIYLKKHNKFFFLNRERIKLFHFTDQFSLLKPKKVWGGKKILTVHDINQKYENIGTLALKQYLDKLGERINSCDRVVAISNFVANDILEYFPHVKKKLSVIYNGADKLILNQDHKPLYQPQKTFLFTIGVVAAKKNFHVLPAILANNDLELIISGILSPYQEDIMREAKKYGCVDRIKLTGPISDDDKAWYYKNCEAFVFPSIAEGFGLPVIEAMHFGKPVFVSNCTSLPEIAGDAAYYFNSFDGEDMQQVFKTGLQHFKEHNPSEQIIAHANKYNWDNTAKQYLQLYQDCIKKK
ncbi:Glycosyltransferase involved in cell wall bisynthesis [Mucilaginibacter lappiensis]|uniref:Glycosyltransferase involved in cell wall biosynthesis n=1 Tax=Mucilaginibacter lappiensis TaxID=354630 RepID=A0ABR6PN79_9SPHI|nr:glycosyltransferase family 1 protein [Mucilaginibacter lappiensis]MBB6111218.1 glycosyltransferase involved in cell wall biosynthesis [Mucilaginibacter lappiensis]SIR73208.1 Glycosyltransferase involved in cell wall bisynthesis [Mucilaginibacter lappiensis]